MAALLAAPKAAVKAPRRRRTRALEGPEEGSSIRRIELPNRKVCMRRKIRVYRDSPHVWVADVSPTCTRVEKVVFPFWRDAFDYAFQKAQERMYHMEPCS